MGASPGGMAEGLDWDALTGGILAVVAKQPPASASASPIHAPPRDVIAKLLAAAFWATLTTDEGRATRFRVAVVPPESLRLGWPALWFTHHEPLNTRSLRKLAHAHDALLGMLVATVANEHEIEFRGIVHDPRRTTYLDALIVEGRGPGQLHVYWRNERVLELVDGTPAYPTEFPFDLTQAAAAIARSVSWARDDPQNREVFLFAYLVLTVAFAIEKLGQGGAIWLLPKGHPRAEALRKQGRRVDAHPSFWDPHRAVLEDRIFRVRATADDPVDRMLVMQGLHDYRRLSSEGLVQAIARLSGVDGAILLSAPPDVLAFGVIANDLRTPARLLRLRRDDHRQVQDVGPDVFGGSRHQSAIGFVATYGGPAIVTSHDGGVSMFLPDDSEEGAGRVIGARVSRLETRRSEPREG